MTLPLSIALHHLETARLGLVTSTVVRPSASVARTGGLGGRQYRASAAARRPTSSGVTHPSPAPTPLHT